MSILLPVEYAQVDRSSSPPSTLKGTAPLTIEGLEIDEELASPAATQAGR